MIEEAFAFIGDNAKYFIIPFFVGLLFYFLSQRSLSKRENSEYKQRVQLAKNDILFGIRPTITEDFIPTKETMESLIASTSIKHTVNIKDVFSVNSLINELIREVMESAFISSKLKKEYCENLAKLKISDAIQDHTHEESKKGVIIGIDRKTTSLISFLITLIVTIITFLLILVSLTTTPITSFYLIMSLALIIFGVYFLIFIINKSSRLRR